MKNYICMLLSVFMLFGFTSCQDQNQSTSINQSEPTIGASSTTKPENYSISIIPYRDYTFGYEAQAGCRQAIADLKKENISITFSFDPPDHNMDAMIWKYEEVIGNHTSSKDAVLFTPTGISGYDDAFRDAKEKGIKTILLDSVVDGNSWDAAYMSNYYNDGVTAANEMVKMLEAEGVNSGKILLLGLNKSSTIIIERVQGFKSVFEGKEYELIEKENFGDDTIGDEKYLKELLKDDANEVSGIIYFDNTWAYVVSDKIEKFDASDSVVFTMFDIYDDGDMEARTGFETGAIDISINTDPYQMGYQGLMGAVELLRGNEINPKKVYIPPIVVTKDNYEEYFEEIDRQVKEAYE